MLIIRDEQMAAFRRAAYEAFVPRAAALLRQSWPGRFVATDEAALRARVRRGLASAEVYGLTGDANLCRYLNMQIALGAEFDVDPRYPWAREVLTDSALSADDKVAELHEEVLAELARGR